MCVGVILRGEVKEARKRRRSDETQSDRRRRRSEFELHRWTTTIGLKYSNKRRSEVTLQPLQGTFVHF